MENKREIIVKKIEKYGFNVKFLNTVIAIMVAIFTITFFIVYSKEKARYDLQNINYYAMLEEIEQNQLNVIFGNVSPNNGSGNKNDVEKPIFASAKEAVLCAFNNFYSYTSYEMEFKGVTTAEAVGQHIEVILQGKGAKWADGVEYEQNMMYETKTNFGQSKASETAYLNGKYKREGKNLKNRNGVLSADFSGQFKKVNSQLTQKPMYIVNSQTILQSTAFSFTRDEDNKILYYTASVRLDTVEAIKTYGQSIKEEGGTSYPNFVQLELTCTIDRNGHLISFKSHEKMTVTKKIMFDITTTTTNDILNIVKSYNQTPSITKPQIA